MAFGCPIWSAGRVVQALASLRISGAVAYMLTGLASQFLLGSHPWEGSVSVGFVGWSWWDSHGQAVSLCLTTRDQLQLLTAFTLMVGGVLRSPLHRFRPLFGGTGSASAGNEACSRRSYIYHHTGLWLLFPQAFLPLLANTTHLAPSSCGAPLINWVLVVLVICNESASFPSMCSSWRQRLPVPAGFIVLWWGGAGEFNVGGVSPLPDFNVK